MQIKTLPALCALILFSVSQALSQQVAQQSSLQDLVNRAARTTVDRFAAQKLEDKHLSITLIDLRDPERPVTASFRGNERIYPASVSKSEEHTSELQSRLHLVCRLLLEKK